MNRIQYLVNKLNEASAAYYDTDKEIMSNKEYDELYDELVRLEKQTGIILSNSPTQNVGFNVVDGLEKVTHEQPALSLDKTKDITEFRKTFSNIPNGVSKDVIVMNKMDGSTIIATYDDGVLTRLATRGNGTVGCDITHNAPFIKGLPCKIKTKKHTVVRGEAVMSYTEFKHINDEIGDERLQYKNPRNLANATIQIFDSREMSKREIWFHAFKLVTPVDNINTFSESFEYLKSLGFNVVPYEIAKLTVPVTYKNSLESVMDKFSNDIDTYDFPKDGLVVALNDFKYADKQPGTGHNPNKLSGFAFKWEDEEVETRLINIEWSASMTGRLNPVAVFLPVELEGTTVTRASIHNVSECEKLFCDKNRKWIAKIGTKIKVYKANKIIPQISWADNETPVGPHEVMLEIPKTCPVCGNSTTIVISDSKNNQTKTLVCRNKDCAAKQLGKFNRFVSRDCMDIANMSRETIEKFVSRGFIKEFADFYRLDRYKDEIISMDGFGEKSYENIINAAEKSRKEATFVKFINAISIDGIGKEQAKILYDTYNQDGASDRDCLYLFFKEAKTANFTKCNGIGEVLNKKIHDWATEKIVDDSDIIRVYNMLEFVTVEKIQKSDKLAGIKIVITGDVKEFKNRNELKTFIESLGGSVTGSVSNTTTYLINNDINSASSKNKKAKELGIPIISETEFLNLVKK